MDIKQRIQELSLDQKAKLYFMGLVRQGKIDTLPEDPKAAYVSMMMDKDDYGRSVSGKDKSTFIEPEDMTMAARARKMAGMDEAVTDDLSLQELASELGYLNEDKQETIIPLDKLTFDMLKQVFSDDYKNVQFTRTQPDGKEGNYYRDSITFPNIDDSRTSIGDMSALEDWKEKTKSRYGNVDILLKPEADMWFDKVEVIDDKFQDTKNKLAQGKAAAMKRDQELGRSID